MIRLDLRVWFDVFDGGICVCGMITTMFSTAENIVLQLHKNLVHHLLMLLESTNVKIVSLHEFQFVFTNQQEDCVVSVFFYQLTSISKTLLV